MGRGAWHQSRIWLSRWFCHVSIIETIELILLDLTTWSLLVKAYQMLFFFLKKPTYPYCIRVPNERWGIILPLFVLDCASWSLSQVFCALSQFLWQAGRPFLFPPQLFLHFCALLKHVSFPGSEDCADANPVEKMIQPANIIFSPKPPFIFKSNYLFLLTFIKKYQLQLLRASLNLRI